MVLETGIFFSQAIWLWRVRHIRRAAKKAGMSYDEYVEKNHDGVKLPRCGSSETVGDVEMGRREDGSEETGTTEKSAVTTQDKATEAAEKTPQIPPTAVMKTSLSG
jgi:hypothetical protein